jgi:hypothetical protein
MRRARHAMPPRRPNRRAGMCTAVSPAPPPDWNLNFIINVLVRTPVNYVKNPAAVQMKFKRGFRCRVPLAARLDTHYILMSKKFIPFQFSIQSAALYMPRFTTYI